MKANDHDYTANAHKSAYRNPGSQLLNEYGEVNARKSAS